MYIYIYIYDSVVVPIKDTAYFWKFSLLLACSARVSNICIYLHSGDPHKVGYSLDNGGHNISFGKCTGGLTILDPPGPIELSHVALWKFRLRFEASGLPPLTKANHIPSMALLGGHGIRCIFTNPNSIWHSLKIEPYTLHAKILLPMDPAHMLLIWQWSSLLLLIFVK